MTLFLAIVITWKWNVLVGNYYTFYTRKCFKVFESCICTERVQNAKCKSFGLKCSVQVSLGMKCSSRTFPGLKCSVTLKRLGTTGPELLYLIACMHQWHFLMQTWPAWAGFKTAEEGRAKNM
jgi:hypothetical protein